MILIILSEPVNLTFYISAKCTVYISDSKFPPFPCKWFESSIIEEMDYKQSLLLLIFSFYKYNKKERKQATHPRCKNL